MVAMCSLLRYPAEIHFPAVMRPLAAAGRPWHPSEPARLGRNAVEDPPQAGCLGRTAAAPWRINRRGSGPPHATGEEDVAVAAVGPPSGLRPRGLHRAPLARSQRAR